jgi:Sporulation and spore germination
MRFRFRVLGPAVAILGLSLALLSPVQASPPARAVLPTLTSVQAQHVGNVDRVTFGFTNGLPADVLVDWVDTLHHDGSGLPVRVAGAKVLMVVFNGTTAHDQNGATVRTRTAYALPNVITTVGAGDFEGTVTFGLGVQKRTSYTITKLQNPDRVVVDVSAGFPTTARKVWLVDSNAVGTGGAPYFVPRPRPIRSDAPAAAALHALFAGPTPQERSTGLRLVRSAAWGFDDLQIAARIARVRLTRGCTSGGSTITVAGSIAPTLRQFPTVDWVKIYAPGGGTEQPTGQVDSIPACLEP